MKTSRIFESVLYASDLVSAERFYREALGLEVIDGSQLYRAFRCAGGVLLLFDPRRSGVLGRRVPSHGAQGPGHLAFGVRDAELGFWRKHLQQSGVSIEAEVEWAEGGRSLYFRDPAGNSLELAPPTLWGGGWGF